MSHYFTPCSAFSSSSSFPYNSNWRWQQTLPDSIFFGFSGRGTRTRGRASEKIEKPKNWKVIPRGGNDDDGAARCCCPERERRRRRRIRVYFSFLLPTSSCVYVDGKGEEEVVRSGVGKVVKYWTFASPPPPLFFPSL